MFSMREKNRKKMKEAIFTNPEAKKFKETFSKKWGVDPFDPAMLKEGFSWSKASAKMARFAEAEQSTAWVQLLRAGVQNIANDLFQSMPGTYEEWVHTVPSKLNTELYAPLESVGFPDEVPEGGYFPEVSTFGLDIKLRNKKYGSIFAATFEMVEDDQTGQMVQRAQRMGEYLKILTEVLVMSKLASPSGGVTYLGRFFPVSETKPSYESNYPWTTSAAPFTGGGYNRPTSFTIFNVAGLTAGLQALGQQLDALGNYVPVQPTHAIVSPQRRFDAAQILHSAYYPAGAQAAGTTGGAFSDNVLKSVVDLIVTPYMPTNGGVINGLSNAWYLVDAKKPAFIWQLREGVSLVAEAPNSGDGFSRDAQRYKARIRQNADFISPLFFWQGNDGSVTS
jgi:phage major head subunit gpT-like protein